METAPGTIPFGVICSTLDVVGAPIAGEDVGATFMGRRESTDAPAAIPGLCVDPEVVGMECFAPESSLVIEGLPFCCPELPGEEPICAPGAAEPVGDWYPYWAAY